MCKNESLWSAHPLLRIDLSLPQLPVFVASYVLSDYGTGAVMGNPTYDARDRVLANQFDICVPTPEEIAASDSPYEMGPSQAKAIREAGVTAGVRILICLRMYFKSALVS